MENLPRITRCTQRLFSLCAENLIKLLSSSTRKNTLQNVTRDSACASAGCIYIPCKSRLDLDKIRSIKQTEDVKPLVTTMLPSFKQYVKSGAFSKEDNMYLLHIEKFLRYFRRDQIFVMNFEALVTNTTDSIARISSFLGIDNIWGVNASLPHVNEHVSGRYLDCHTFNELYKFYEPYNERLYKFLKSNEEGAPSKFEPSFLPFMSKIRTKCIDK